MFYLISLEFNLLKRIFNFFCLFIIIRIGFRFYILLLRSLARILTFFIFLRYRMSDKF